MPLGEVSLDEAEVKQVGVIKSLVETDGTIVIEGESPPLDEGCVLASCVSELQADVRNTRACEERLMEGGGGWEGGREAGREGGGRNMRDLSYLEV